MTTATLGFAIDSSAAVQAKERLEKMSGASMHAENAANSLNAATVRASGGNKTFAQTSDMVATAQARVAAATNATTALMNKQASASKMQAYQNRMLAVQIGDVVQSLALGIPVQQVALQQGFQIQGMYGSLGATLRGLAGFAARLAPIGAALAPIAIGFAAITNEVNKTTSASVSMFDVLKAGVQVTAERIQTLLQPAFDRFARLWDRYTPILVANLKDAANAIIGLFVGSAAAVKAAWGQLPEVFAGIGEQIGYRLYEAFRVRANKIIETVQVLSGWASTKLGVDIPAPDMLPWMAPPTGRNQEALSDVTGAFAGGFNQNFVGDYASDVAQRAREIAEATEGIGGAAGRAKDAWEGLRKVTGDTADKLRERVENLGSSIGGIFRGLLDQTMTWKDAAINAIQSVLSFLNQRSLDQTGSGLFGGGFFGSILSGLFGFASGGFTGPGPAHQPAGVVHAGEFVFSKRATDRIGVGNLDRMHRSAKGYASGGYVTANNNMPGAANQNMVVDVRVSVDDDGKLAVVARQVATETVAASAPAITQAAKTETLRSFTGNGEGEKLMRNRFSVKPNTRR